MLMIHLTSLWLKRTRLCTARYLLEENGYIYSIHTYRELALKKQPSLPPILPLDCLVGRHTELFTFCRNFFGTHLLDYSRLFEFDKSSQYNSWLSQNSFPIRSLWVICPLRADTVANITWGGFNAQMMRDLRQTTQLYGFIFLFTKQSS